MKLLTFSIVLLLASIADAETFYVAPTGADTATGSLETPFKTIQRGVDQLKPGDVLEIAGGTYRESIHITRGGEPGKPITIRGKPGEHTQITGADVLAGGKLQSDGTIVYPWDHVFEIGRDEKNQPIRTHPQDEFHQLIGRPEQVMVDLELLDQRPSNAELDEGEFKIDDVAKTLTVRLPEDTADEATVSASVRSTWIETDSAAHVVLQNLSFMMAANFAQRGALQIGRGWDQSAKLPSNWTLINCWPGGANGAAVSISGRGHELNNVFVMANGNIGVSATRCDALLVQNCIFDANNYKKYDTGWEAGGVKITLSRDVEVRNSFFKRNRGSGLWFDIGCENIRVFDSFFERNTEAGLFFEISDGLIAERNTFLKNATTDDKSAWGMAGVTLSNSRNCRVEHNLFRDNRDSIAWREQARTTPRIGKPIDIEESIATANHVIANNGFDAARRYALAFWWDTELFDAKRPSPLKPANITVRDNAYAPGSGEFLLGAQWKKGCQTFEDEGSLRTAAGILTKEP